MNIKALLFSGFGVFFLAMAFSQPSFAGAEERIPKLTGQYRWKGEFLSAAQVDRQIVHEISSKETERRLQLQRDGYTCEAKPRQTTLCSRFQSLTQLPEAAKKQMVKQVRDLSFEVLEMSKGHHILVDGESYKEFQVHQVVKFNGEVHPVYRVMLLPQVTKVVLGEPEGSYHSFVYENSQLQYWARANVKHDTGWTEYLALAPLH